MADQNPDGTDCSRLEPYALQVLGEAMAPEFPDRCVVIIAPGDRRDPGSYVFAQVAGERWFRKYVRDREGGEHLVAENPSYPEIALAGRDWTVLGVIVQRNIRRKIKHYHPDQG